MTTGAETDDAKRELRAQMRLLRNGLVDRPERSARILAALTQRPELLAAGRVMVYTSLAGEPDTARLIVWCHEMGKHTCLPEDDDVDASWPDVIVIPGLAFTVDGQRLGQGGGWYDRFLPDRRADCTTIGVCFSAQLVDDLPTDVHDVVLDVVVAD
jgi:5-formyltetrahydrofolate cyclo-ligase